MTRAVKARATDANNTEVATQTDRSERPAAGRRPRILGIGGTQRPSSSSELALQYALDVAANLGCVTESVTIDELLLPLFDPGDQDCLGAADGLLRKVRAADGLLIASPGYHGNMSGLLKNALDYLEALATDPEPYLSGRAVGCIVTASGWQACFTTMAALRTTVHALRGWTAPLGVPVNSSTRPFNADGLPKEEKLRGQLEAVVKQVVDFSEQMRVQKL